MVFINFLVFKPFKNKITSTTSRQVILFLLFQVPFLLVAQLTPAYYVSNAGNDSFAGTSSFFSKKMIAAIAPALKKTADANGIVGLGLKAGDIFEETLVTSYPIAVNTFGDPTTAADFAVLNGTKEVAFGWLKQPGATATFHQSIAYNGFVGYGINNIGQYSFIYVYEIDKELEKTAPYTARKLLVFLSDTTAVENTPGSFYTPVTNQNPIPVYIHTSDGNSPNYNTKYRYEVTVRDFGINSTYQPNNRFENLWVRGFGAGIGMLPGGDNSYYNKIIFGPGAGIHHLLARSGTINHSLFLPGAKNTNQFALVFYDTEGLGRHCTVKNSMFLDIPMPLYMHTSGGTNYGAVAMDSIVGFADTLTKSPFVYTSNNDSVLLNNIYADGYSSGYNYGNAGYCAIKNSIFKAVQFGIAYNNAYNAITAIIENVFIKTSGTDFTSGIIVQDRTIVQLHNSILQITNNDNSTGSSVKGAFVKGSANKIVAAGNIFICEVGIGKSLTAATTNTNNGIASSKDSWDNNVYILLKGNAIQWAVTNPATNAGSTVVSSFEGWQKQSGQDAHSIFFDLRNDPRGLKAIFEDPENGNYDLATTKEGMQIAAMQAGMKNAITCFLKRPSYEQAAAMIRNNTVFSTSNCRNPCTQNTIKVNATFGLDSLNNRQIKLKWNVAEQHGIAKYIILQSVGNAPFSRINSIPVSADSMYTVIENVQPGIEYKYRLMVVATAGNQCYSAIRTIKINDNNPLTIYPNPARDKITISMTGYIGKANFKVINSMGEIVLIKDNVNLSVSPSFDLTKQAKGIYWLRNATPKGISVQKFILQ